MIRACSLLANTVLFSFIVSNTTLAATYHVAPSGSDNNPGTLSQPWRTITKANSNLKAGDTVLIHAGTYHERIRPANSGSSDSQRIIYQAYGDGDVILTNFSGTSGPGQGAIAVGERKYVTVSGRGPNDPATIRRFRLLPTGAPRIVGNVCGSEGVIVENIYAICPNDNLNCSRGFAFCVDWWSGNYETKYNILRNSHIIGNSSTSTNPADFTEDLITVAKNAHHNLIENNTFEIAKHVVLKLTDPNSYAIVVRGNTVYNPEHTAISVYHGGTSFFPDDARYLLEGNTFRASSENPSFPEGTPGNSVQWGAGEVIFRYNVMTESNYDAPHDEDVGGLNGTTGSKNGNGYRAWRGRVYNNTIVRNKGSAISVQETRPGGLAMGDNKFWNNFVYDSLRPSRLDRMVDYSDSNFDTNDRYVANVLGIPGGSPGDRLIRSKGSILSLADAITRFDSPKNPNFKPWHGFNNVYDANPGFADYGRKNYTLPAGNPYIDAGAPLTQVATSDSGTGNNLLVDDSRWFYSEASQFPAWMGVRNDWIAVGPTLASATKVQIASIDDAKKSLTLTKSISRNDGDFVWLWKDSAGKSVIFGAGPDIGAFEYAGAGGGSGPTINPPKNLRVLNNP